MLMLVTVYRGEIYPRSCEIYEIIFPLTNSSG